ncbi:MAG: hypothetical protein U5L95_00540 [Candidatus Saccharibacteria bacterium]|nr:hypothetical protein [Candidatus Saccharibacteria bacterium]
MRKSPEFLKLRMSPEDNEALRQRREARERQNAEEQSVAENKELLKRVRSFTDKMLYSGVAVNTTDSDGSTKDEEGWVTLRTLADTRPHVVLKARVERMLLSPPGAGGRRFQDRIVTRFSYDDNSASLEPQPLLSLDYHDKSETPNERTYDPRSVRVHPELGLEPFYMNFIPTHPKGDERVDSHKVAVLSEIESEIIDPIFQARTAEGAPRK